MTEPRAEYLMPSDMPGLTVAGAVASQAVRQDDFRRLGIGYRALGVAL
jgi:hypothetical protein